MHNLQIITDKKIWNDFVTKSDLDFYSFVSSWEWWDFQETLWYTPFRYGIYSADTLVWVFMLIKVSAKRWTYFFTPHGPLIVWNYFDILEDILPKLKSIAKSEWISFIRLNSTQTNTIKNASAYKKIWFKHAPMHVHAEDTHLLDITPSEEDLLAKMHKKDRYYINRAIKEWVKISIDNKEDHIETLIDFHHKHATRTNGKNTYSAFSEKYIKNLYKVFPEENISTISAWLDGIESILMTIRFWDTCVYYVAASDIKNKKFSPNYLCQWEAIKKAKSDGAKQYNFWWVSPDDNPAHPIAGVTKFKRKFAGYDHSLLHAQDLVISNKYWFNWVVETLRRKKRWYYYKKPE